MLARECVMGVELREGESSAPVLPGDTCGSEPRIEFERGAMDAERVARATYFQSDQTDPFFD